MQLWQKQTWILPSLDRWAQSYLIFFLLLQFISSAAFDFALISCTLYFLTSVTSLLHNSFQKGIQAVSCKGKYLQCHSTACKKNRWAKGICKRELQWQKIAFQMTTLWVTSRNLQFNSYILHQIYSSFASLIFYSSLRKDKEITVSKSDWKKILASSNWT